MSPARRALAFVAVVMGVLVATTIPGPFTVDENNYLVTAIALRAGRVTVPGTEALPPTRATLAFDPMARQRPPTAPARPAAPPLWAFLALPALPLGWRGLTLLNALGIGVAGLLVFGRARQVTGLPRAGGVAVAALLLGAYLAEYAQGLWPHGVSLGLCTAAFVLAGRAREEDSLGAAAAAGLLVGWACGVRYPNLLVLVGVGAGLVLVGPHRRRVVPAFALAAALPLALSSAINQARLESWNPVSKGPRYLRTHAPRTGSRLADMATAAWMRVVDYTVKPVPSEEWFEANRWIRHVPESGAYLVTDHGLRKAWAQSAPWTLLALGVMAWAWIPRRRGPEVAEPVRRELRAAGLVVAAMVGGISFFGPARHEGVCFNQRYLLDCLGVAALALGLHLGARPAPARWIAGGAAAGLVAVALSLRGGPEDPTRQWLLMRAPLGIGLALILADLVDRAGKARALALGAAVAWAAGVHVGEDLMASWRLRLGQYLQLRALDPVVPDRAALMVHGALRDSFGRYWIDRDMVLLDLSLIEPAEAVELAGACLGEGRTVILLGNDLPDEFQEAFERELQVVELEERPLVEGGEAALRPMRLESR